MTSTATMRASRDALQRIAALPVLPAMEMVSFIGPEVVTM